jgi:DNA-binding IclR family transcriptional regulator
VDVTRAILMALADVHPRGLPVEALAEKVSCERAALQGQLRLLSQTGAICSADEVSITEPAIEMLRHHAVLRTDRH